ncbi:MAG: toprim domain-containing protein [Deltaproteobacteria bacterium]|nr:toprim domain-containing protein [Deltaproteobacteria bacterium]
MARIPEGELERLKAEVSVERLAESQGIVLERRGQDRVGLCPFHDDHEPSLVITPAKNLWHCLGACQAGGSVVDWVMRAEGVSFRHAVELLQADYQPTSSPKTLGKRSTVQKLPTALEASAEDERLAGQVIEYYHESLLQSPEALAYLEKRGIASSEAIAKFKLGFANRTLGYRLPAKNRREGAAIRGALQRIGLLRPSGHEHFNGSLVIPIFGEDGQVTEVYGRKITPGLREGTPLHLYLPGPHRGIWNRSALKTSKEIILCESLIDALTFWCAGYRNVTTSYGVEGFTKDHLAAFKQYETERVLIAYDRDAAGDAAAEKLSKQLQTEGLDCYRIQFAKGMDANEYALEVRPASKSLGIAIRSALWLGKGSAKPITTTATAPMAPSAESIANDAVVPAPASVPPSLPSKPPVGAPSRPGPAEWGREERRETEPNPSLAAVLVAAEEAGEGKRSRPMRWLRGCRRRSCRRRRGRWSRRGFTATRS